MANNTNNFVSSYDHVTNTKLTSHSSSSSYPFTPSCRLCATTTIHEDQKKKICNNNAAAVAVGKQNNLELLQPIHDSTVCDENQSNKKDIMGRPKILKVYQRRAKKTNT